MTGIAIASNLRGSFLQTMPSDSPLARGLEVTSDLDNARRFSDQNDVDAWVTARGGVVGGWIYWALP